MSEHTVLIQFIDYPGDDLDPLHALEASLSSAISEAKVGEYDGNQIALDGSDGTLFMYGPDAETLYAAIKPIVLGNSLMKGARITLRFGPPSRNTRQRTIDVPRTVQ